MIQSVKNRIAVSDFRDWRWLGIPVTLALLVQLALYAWSAPRGFEFSDDSFYLVSMLHWREFVATFTFFGMYFEGPFRLLGQDIGAMRMFGFTLLLASSAHAAFGVLKYVDWRLGGRRAAPHWPFVVAALSASALYFGYLPMFRMPSYNLAALCSSLVATGLLLRVIVAQQSWRRTPGIMFAYGVALGVCVLCKVTGALLIASLHFAFLWSVTEQPWKRANLPAMVALSISGVLLNVALLSLLMPDWVHVLDRGVQLMATTSGERSLRKMFSFLRWGLPQVLVRHGPTGVILASVYVAGRWLARRHMPPIVRWIDVSLFVVFSAVLSTRPTTQAWMPTLVLVLALLMWQTAAVQGPHERRRDPKLIALVVMLAASAPALSIGTDLPIMAHSEINAVFAVMSLVLVLYRLHVGWVLSGCGNPRVTSVGLFVLALPGLAVLVNSLIGLEPLFRQRVALIAQNEPVWIGSPARPVRVDATTGRVLQSLSQKALRHGWKVGGTMLDFTGMGPGMPFALGARPLRVGWLLGDFEERSRRGAAQALSWMTPEELCSSWILSSTLSPLRIDGWQDLLRARIGRDCHEPVTTLKMPGWREIKKEVDPVLDVTVWRPKAL